MPVSAPTPAELPGLQFGREVALTLAGTPLVVLNKNSAALNTGTTGTPPDIYAILGGTAPNHANVVRLPVNSRRLRWLSLYWMFMYRMAEVTSLDSATAPVVQAYGRLRVPSAAERLWPQDVESGSPDLTGNGIWASVGMDPGSSITSPGFSGGVNMFTTGRITNNVSEWIHAGWRYLMGRLWVGRPYDIQGFEELVVSITTVSAVTITLAGEDPGPSRQLVLGHLF